MLTVNEAAKFLKVSQMTVWRWCQSGKLPAFKIGREWRIERTALETVIRQNLQKSRQDTESH